MEIQSKIEDKVITAKVLTIHINPKEKDSIVDVIESLLKKSKPDRFEEYVIKSLLEALENPLEEPICQEIVVEKPAEVAVKYEPKPLSKKSLPVDKKKVIEEMKVVFEVRNGVRSMQAFIQESVDFIRNSIGSKVLLKDDSIEGFFDFLVENKIIDSDGNKV